MKNVRMAVSKMQSQLEGLKAKQLDIIYSGRDKQWQKRNLDEAVNQTKAKIKELEGEALSEWLKEYAAAKHSEPKDNFVERNFYTQKFNAMLQNVSPENIPELFKKVASDPETAKYKQDFLDLADLKCDDENRSALEMAKREKMSVEEKEQQKQIDKVANMKDHLTMISNMATDTLINDIVSGTGEPSMDLVGVFDEALQKADKVAGRGVGEKNEERPENQEMLRQTMAQTQSE